MTSQLLCTRHLTPEDGPAVDTVFAGLSARSRYLRFHTAMPRLPGSIRRGLLDVDGRDHVALVAEVPGPGGPTPVGIARLIRIGPQEGELAIAIIDDWHGLGIGRNLLTELDELARRRGYTLLHADVLPENQQVLRLLKRVFPEAVRHWERGVIRVDYPLTSARRLVIQPST